MALVFVCADYPYVYKAVVVTLYCESIQHYVLKTVVVPENREVLEMLYYFFVRRSRSLVIDFIIMSCDDCVANTGSDIDFIIVSIKYHIITALSDSEMRIVMINYEVTFLILSA